jgi:hypothetical protein
VILAKNNKLLDFFNKNKTFILLAALAIVVFHKYLVMIITFILLAALGLFTIKISRIVPHISAETVTASSILMGYMWGWQVGLVFGLVIGFSGFINASQMNITTIVCSLLMGLCGILGAVFFSLNYPFWLAFIITYVIRANLSFFLISPINPNVMENILHSYVESLFNIIITLQFLQIIYFVLMKLV